jgi:transposase
MPQVDEIVGIDVSKRKLDWCIRDVAAGTTAHTPNDCNDLAASLVERGIKVAIMEASGGYEQTIALILREAGIAVRIIDPKRIRSFAEAGGSYAKTDKIDAKMIAWFGATFPEKEREPDDIDREPLAALVGMREDLVSMRSEWLNRAEHGLSGLAQKVHNGLIKNFNQAVAKLDAAIAKAIEAQPGLAQDAELITSVPGLGLQTAAATLAWLPELGRIEHEQISALVGVAPYDDSSGERDGARHIAGGRHRLRRALYMATLGAATQHNPVLKAFYNRLRAKGKSAKVALVACMRKLLGILNAMLAHKQAWAPPQPAVA